jgi:hypothetical protein
MEEERIESWMREQEIESDISSMVRKSSKLTFLFKIGTHAAWPMLQTLRKKSKEKVWKL